MANATIINATYDLTNIISNEVLNDPPYWLALINQQVGGFIFVTFLAIFGVVLWLIQKNNGSTDGESIAYAGLICTVVGAFLFVIQITAMPNVKLLTWVQLLPFFVVTAVAMIMNKVNQKY